MTRLIGERARQAARLANGITLLSPTAHRGTLTSLSKAQFVSLRDDHCADDGQILRERILATKWTGSGAAPPTAILVR